MRQETDGSGNILVTRGFDPYGVPLSGNGGTPFGFTGEQTDVTGLVFLRARYYVPWQGRFAQQDPVPGLSTLPQSQNAYPYATNNPVLYVDASGEFPGPLWPPPCQNRCAILGYFTNGIPAVRNQDTGFYADASIIIIAHPLSNKEYCLFVQWVKGKMVGKNVNGQTVGTEWDFSEWRADIPGGTPVVAPTKSGSVVIPEGAQFEWPKGTFRYFLRSSAIGWNFNDIPGFTSEAVPLASGGTYTISLDFQLNIYDKSDFAAILNGPMDPPPVFSIPWAFHDVYKVRPWWQ